MYGLWQKQKCVREHCNVNCGIEREREWENDTCKSGQIFAYPIGMTISMTLACGQFCELVCLWLKWHTVVCDCCVNWSGEYFGLNQVNGTGRTKIKSNQIWDLRFEGLRAASGKGRWWLRGVHLSATFARREGGGGEQMSKVFRMLLNLEFAWYCGIHLLSVCTSQRW